jgi:hypothetical protein
MQGQQQLHLLLLLPPALRHSLPLLPLLLLL